MKTEHTTLRPAWKSGDKTGSCIMTLPAKIREQAGLEHGDVLIVTCTAPGKIEMRKVKEE